MPKALKQVDPCYWQPAEQGMDQMVHFVLVSRRHFVLVSGRKMLHCWLLVYHHGYAGLVSCLHSNPLVRVQNNPYDKEVSRTYVYSYAVYCHMRHNYSF